VEEGKMIGWILIGVTVLLVALLWLWMFAAGSLRDTWSRGDSLRRRRPRISELNDDIARLCKLNDDIARRVDAITAAVDIARMTRREKPETTGEMIARVNRERAAQKSQWRPLTMAELQEGWR
jgi:hypothetical protein